MCRNVGKIFVKNVSETDTRKNSVKHRLFDYGTYHRIQQLLSEGKKWDEMLYLNFEDERLENFDTEDFNKILECHQEMYAQRPMLFLDEIQNVEHWEKFVRRMADSKYTVFITGSNAKMLSSEINTTLGGRFIAVEVYPYSFREFLNAHRQPYSELDLLTTGGRAHVVRLFDEYLHNGGLPESALMPVKRNYLSSVYQKIYMGDIIARNKISNVASIRLLVRKSRLIITYDEERIVEDNAGKIEIIPCWKWQLKDD